MKRKKDIDTKIDELAHVVTRGFAESRKEIDELAQMVAGGFTETQKEIRGVHDELYEVRDELKGDMKFLRGDIDIMLDRHIGTFRKNAYSHTDSFYSKCICRSAREARMERVG